MKEEYFNINLEVDLTLLKSKLYRLIYFEEGELIEGAIVREKQLKRWHKEWK